ncbi:MAG: polysaccharide biosynthesis/export family protein [Pseudomonadota bacterium]
MHATTSSSWVQVAAFLFAFAAFPLSGLAQGALAAPAASAPTDLAEYVLGEGDVVKIEVYDEPEMTTESQIQGAGLVNFPLIGQVGAKGLSVTQLQEAIRQKLANGFIRKPTVRVNVTHFRRFYVTGEVKQPGGIPYVLGLSIGKAIAMAGGLSGRASKRGIYLILEGQTEEKKMKVDMDSLVHPGDTIIVEESLF